MSDYSTSKANQRKVRQAKRQWFEQYCNRLSEGILLEAKSGGKYCCPCCGYPTLDERGGYDICELCNWEDDGQDDPHAAEVWGGPNSHYSLSLARENFARYFIMYSPDDLQRSVSGNSPAGLKAKQSIAAAFDAIPQADESERIRLWKLIKIGEEVLCFDLVKRARQMEIEAKNANDVESCLDFRERS